MNRVHPNCTERKSLNKECGWKGGDRSGLAQGQELTGRKRKTKTSLQERKKRKTYLTLTGLLMEGPKKPAPCFLPSNPVDSLTWPRAQPKMTGLWRTPTHSLDRLFLTTASWKNLAAGGWVWFTKPRTSACTGSWL